MNNQGSSFDPANPDTARLPLPVTVVIPFHNSVHWLRRCLRALDRSSGRPAEIVIIDDRSRLAQGVAARELADIYGAKVLANDGDPGFGGACNFGVTVTTTELVLLLNSDCLVAPNTLVNMVAAANVDQAIALVTALSNGAVNAQFDMFVGLSFVEMSALLEGAFEGSDPPERISDILTAEGHCLLVRRSIFLDLGGFDASWGLGYAEETHLHMRAVEIGWRSVACLNTYVFHFGQGSFKFLDGMQELRERNQARFWELWDKQFKERARQCRPPSERVADRIHHRIGDRLSARSFDVLFLLPSASQGIGGVHVVLDIVNDLILDGISAGCLIVDSTQRGGYSDEMFFEPMHLSIEDLSKNFPLLNASIYVSTLYTTAEPAARLAKHFGGTMLQFIQGFEPFFDNGMAHASAERSYSWGDEFLTTSRWLARRLRPYVRGRPIGIAEPPVDRLLFQNEGEERTHDVCVVFRSAPDKGQFLLAEAVKRLVDEHSVRVLALCDSRYAPTFEARSARIEVVLLPLSRDRIARLLVRCKVFLDLSLHEGYGLMPFEAKLCGCRLVLSNSGGVLEYFENHNDYLVPIGGETIDAVVEPVLQSLARGPIAAPRELSVKSPSDVSTNLAERVKQLQQRKHSLAYEPGVVSGDGQGLRVVSVKRKSLGLRFWRLMPRAARRRLFSAANAIVRYGPPPRR